MDMIREQFGRKWLRKNVSAHGKNRDAFSFSRTIPPYALCNWLRATVVSRIKHVLQSACALFVLLITVAAPAQEEFFYVAQGPGPVGARELLPQLVDGSLTVDYTYPVGPVMPLGNTNSFLGPTPVPRWLAPDTVLRLAQPVMDHPNLGLEANLLYWDGSESVVDGSVTQDDVIFTLPPSNTRLHVLYDPDPGLFANMETKGILDGGVTGIDFYFIDETIGTGNTVAHYHIVFRLIGDDTSLTNESPDGVYLFANRVNMDGFKDSDVVYALLHKGMSTGPTGQLAAAESFVDDKLVNIPVVRQGFDLAGDQAQITLTVENTKMVESVHIDRSTDAFFSTWTRVATFQSDGGETNWAEALQSDSTTAVYRAIIQDTP